jgi:hypothetical protein
LVPNFVVERANTTFRERGFKRPYFPKPSFYSSRELLRPLSGIGKRTSPLLLASFAAFADFSRKKVHFRRLAQQVLY